MLASNGNSQTLEPSGSLFPLFLFCPCRRVSSSPLSFCRSQETRRGHGESKQRARTEGRPRTQPTKQRRSLREQGTGWGSQTLFFEVAVTSDGSGSRKACLHGAWTAIVVGRCSRLLAVVVANLDGHVRTFHNGLEIQILHGNISRLARQLRKPDVSLAGMYGRTIVRLLYNLRHIYGKN